MDDGRRRHYGVFYGLEPVPTGPEPLMLVHGNCQAESIRILCSPFLRSVRIPPVHELTAEDLPHLDQLLTQVDVVVAQPIHDGYRDLPLGTAEVLARAPRARRPVLFPVLRWSGLHPFQVIVRTPVGDPPLVPYHDLRTLAAAAGRRLPEVPAADAVRAVRDESVAELRRRTEKHATVPADDLFLAAGAEACQVINHPGNLVLRGVAERVLAACGIEAEVDDPGRILLNSVHAPVLPAVLAALGLQDSRPDDRQRDPASWLVQGETVPDEEVRRVQTAWYAEHPEVVEAGLERHADLLDLLAS